MGKLMSDETKYKLAHELGFGEKIEDGNWDDVTTGEIGSMVREAIKRGEQSLVEEAKLNGEIHQNAR